MSHPLRIFNRYTRQFEEEPVCGEWFLRLAYGTFFGRFFQSLLGSRPCLSRLAALYANGHGSAKKILPFVRRYGIDAGESLTPVGQFATFNEFFCRHLKPEARPIAPDRDSIIAPADGRYFHIPDLSRQKSIAIKGRRLRLEEMLGSRSLAEKFRGGSASIARLCPLDYHRFHFPCDGVPGAARPIPGRLHSVHPLALRHRHSLSRNKRHLTRIVTHLGEVLMLEVGATFIGSIGQTYTPHRHVKKGLEKGFFSFGGSTVILLFERGALVPERDLLERSGEGVETYIRMGDLLGRRG
jgi:phosphatidylserine decarboxylase